MQVPGSKYDAVEIFFPRVVRRCYDPRKTTFLWETPPPSNVCFASHFCLFFHHFGRILSICKLGCVQGDIYKSPFFTTLLFPRIEQANPSNQLASCHLGILEGLVAGRPSNTGWRWDSSRYPAVATRAVQHAPAIQSTVGNAFVTWRFTKGGKCNPWGWDRHNIEKQLGGGFKYFSLLPQPGEMI